VRPTARADFGRTSEYRARRHAPRLVVLFGFLSLVGASLLMPATKASPAPGTAIVNVASVTSTLAAGTPPTTTLSNRATTLVATLPLANLAKTVDPTGPVRAGTDLRYTLSFANGSPATLTNVTIVDALDPFLASAAGVTTGSIPNHGPGGGRVPVAGAYDAASRRVTFTIPSLPP